MKSRPLLFHWMGSERESKPDLPKIDFQPANKESYDAARSEGWIDEMGQWETPKINKTTPPGS